MFFLIDLGVVLWKKKHSQRTQKKPNKGKRTPGTPHLEAQRQTPDQKKSAQRDSQIPLNQVDQRPSTRTGVFGKKGELSTD